MTIANNYPPQTFGNIAGGRNGYVPQSYPENRHDGYLAALLDRTANWIMSYAYSREFRLIVTGHGMALADVFALAAYASWMTPVPALFHTTGRDLTGRRLLEAFAFLTQDCRVTVDMSPGRQAGSVVDVSTDAIDVRTAAMAERQLLPSLATSDRRSAADIRRDIRNDASERKTHILSNGEAPSTVVRSVAHMAGGKWERVAGMLLDPALLPPIADAGEGVA